jgi:hypothetical protein
MQEGSVHHGRAAYRALGLALVALALAGCGGGEDAAAPATSLTVREYDGEALTDTITLDCSAPGGACERVVALLPRLAPDPGEVCTQVFGGPERRVVSGVVEGRPVDIEITRTDGCQIARYDLLTAALGQ